MVHDTACTARGQPPLLRTEMRCVLMVLAEQALSEQTRVPPPNPFIFSSAFVVIGVQALPEGFCDFHLIVCVHNLLYVHGLVGELLSRYGL